MPEYDLRERPPAPIATLVVTNFENGKSISLRGKLDTGASISVLPLSALDLLELYPKGETAIVGYDGTRTVREIYYADLEIESVRLASVRLTTTPRDEMLLGRDVLNQFLIILDGKAQTFEMRAT
ncbi:MAG: retroviral-like aspartic protease family protein [Chloroflexi bacterium]|nr:retroviral-like aspartic protease family protein [Chloroflexota bacterium]